MKLLVAVLGTVGLWSIALVFLNMAHLTQKWEVVTRSHSYYRLFYVAAGFVALASMVRLVRIGYLGPVTDAGHPATPPLFYEPQSWFYVCLYYAPLAIGVTISLVLTWKNWGWLQGEWKS